MRIKIILLLLCILPILAFQDKHKYYVSVSSIQYSQTDQSLQIISRVFIDDLEAVLSERYDFVGHLATKKEKKDSEYFIAKYLKTKFRFWVDNQAKQVTYIGREYEDDMIKIYLELPEITNLNGSTIHLRNEVLFDMFPEQQNIIHFKGMKSKKSYIFTKEIDKALLKI